jgi:hypothetical protein
MWAERIGGWQATDAAAVLFALLLPLLLRLRLPLLFPPL